MILSPGATEAIVKKKIEDKDIVPLTEREREVLKLMISGMNNNDIAASLVVSVSTVKYHISNILSKLGVDNRVAAVTTAIQKRIV